MSRKLRASELCKELGLTPSIALQLVRELKFNAHSYSSVLIKAEADRMRRLAVSRGLCATPSEEQSDD
jgi:hypothetical protein